MGLFKSEAKKQEEFNKRLFTFFNTNTALIELPSNTDELYRQAENKVWYQAQDASELIHFYKTRLRVYSMYQTNQFYKLCTQDSGLAFMHYNLAQAISKSMTNLLFGKEPKITAKSGNQKNDRIFNAAIEDILKDNDKYSLYNKSSELASYSGRVGFKLILDTDVSEFPIIQVYPKEQIELLKVYGRTTDIVFKDYFDSSDETRPYVLYSFYGKGYIKYKLYRESFTATNQDRNREEIPLDTIPQTSGLKDKYFYYTDGKPVDKILAVVIDNKTDGLSDYTGCIDDFIAIDETYTQFETFVRSSGLKIYLPERLAERDAKTGEVISRNIDFSTRVSFVPTSNPNWQMTEIKRDIVDNMDRTLKGYVDTMNSLIMRACQTAGLSTATMGYDIAGANSSGEALNIRERVSIRTRDEKLQRWSEGLSKLFERLLILYSANVKNDKIYVENVEPNFYVEFPPYGQNLENDKNAINITLSKLNNGLITLEDALQEINPAMDKDDIKKKEEELKKEPDRTDNKLEDL